MDWSVMNRRIFIALHDLLMVVVAWSLAYLTRYNFSISADAFSSLLSSLPIVVVAQGLGLRMTGLYRGLWRFASIPDFWNITKAVIFGSLISGLVLFLFNRLEGVPRSTLILYPLFLTFLLSAPRLIYRMWKEHGLRLHNVEDRKRALILGAGAGGEMLARDMLRDDGYLPVGFLDDNLRLKRAKIRGIPVLGVINSLPQAIKAVSPDVLIIAMPSATTAQMQRIVEICEGSGLPFRTLPRIQDIVSGRSSINELREVAIEDLLGREPVSLDWQRVSQGLAGKRVLITGGGGSIGSELCRQIARMGPSKLVLLEQSEFNLYNIEMELQQAYPQLKLYACLGSVCDEATVNHVLAVHRPEVIFHAAAYKHVPILEGQAREAVSNNVFGTRTMAMAADRHGCGTFVLISTDKAVNPANVMGASKRIAELYCQAMNGRSNTSFITVRFGNVLGSAGSVIPLFQKQIDAGGPVTVTHPEVTRYFMTIPEACLLIMQSCVLGQGGEIFVLDMGESVKICYLAEQMIRLSGKVPQEDIEIVYSGLRPGEKLFEELFYDEEHLTKTEHAKILLAHPHAVEWLQLNQSINALYNACQLYDETQIEKLIKTIVPELHQAQIASDNIVPFKQAQG